MGGNQLMLMESLLPPSKKIRLDSESEISFEVSSSINGGVLRCSGANATAVGSSEVTLQEENSVGELVLQ